MTSDLTEADATVPASLIGRYPGVMEQDAAQREDAYYDESVGMVVTRSGKARWRERLAERAASRDTEASAAFLAELRRGGASPA